MSKLEFLLEAPDAEQLAADFKDQFPPDSEIEVHRLQTRSPEALAVVSMGLDTIGAVGGAVAFADLLLRWLAEPEIGKVNFKASIHGALVTVTGMTRAQVIKLLTAVDDNS